MYELQTQALHDHADVAALLYRSEAFHEDLHEDLDEPVMGWHPLERLAVALPLLCLLALMADWFHP